MVAISTLLAPAALLTLALATPVANPGYYPSPANAGLICTDTVSASNAACLDINHEWKRDEGKDLGSADVVLEHIKKLLESVGSGPYKLHAFDLINGDTGKTAHVPATAGTEEQVLAAVKKALEASS